jgi:pimeloyl-ACP methyl ester carboxylesterase
MRTAAHWTAVVAGLLILSACRESTDVAANTIDQGRLAPARAAADTLPIVFVHGAAGSAQQFQSQAMRYIVNGVPPDRIHTFEYDAGAQGSAVALAGQQLLPLYQFLLDVTAESGADQVYLIGHSLGTIVSTEYLSSGFVTGPVPAPAPASLVAKFIGIDGVVSPVCPGLVPCKGIFDGTSSVGLGQDNTYIENQAHVEVATSAESFAAQFEFLYGVAPQSTEIDVQGPTVSVSGRAVTFPENTPRPGAQLEIWPIDADTGHRTASAPAATTTPDADGFWGPVELSTQQHYEFLLKTSDTVDHHFYMPRFVRNTVHLRLLSGPDDSDSRANTHLGDGHVALVMSRMREWFGNHPSAGNDIVEISTRSPHLGDQAPVNAITPDVGTDTIGIHIHDDAATPRQTTLQPLPYFPDQAFQTGVDVYMPATDPPDGTVSVRLVPRGREEFAQVVNLPNWASSRHRVSVMFDDFDLAAR